MVTSYIYFENQYFRFPYLPKHCEIAIKIVKTLPNQRYLRYARFRQYQCT